MLNALDGSVNNMLTRDLLTTSVTALRRNKSRSALTILGIVIGITSVILMLSIGQSAEGLILNQVADLGADLVFVEPAAGDPTAGPPDPFIEQTLTLDDAEALEKSPYVAAVSSTLTSTLTVSYQEETQFTSINGTDHNYLEVFPADILYGRFLGEDDVKSYARVAVLGLEIAQDLYGDQNPVGMKVKVGDVSMRVIGVLDEQGTRFFQNLDDQIAIPVTTMQRDVMGLDTVNYIAMVAVGDIEMVKEEVRWVMRDEHNIDNPDGDSAKDDFFVSSQSDAVEIIGVVGAVLTLLLSSIAAISLVVGGIGIMNIMLVSVTERTREIGLRKAVGATRKEILQQFLVEAVLLTLLGGLAGVFCGVVISVLVGVVGAQLLDGWTISIPVSAIFLAVIVSTVVGVIFGVYPARQAAKLDPIDALRYE